MTSIDFHTDISDKINYTCRLVRKAVAARNRVAILSDDETELHALDAALWTFSEIDFLPHVRSDHPLAAQTPVILLQQDDINCSHHQILINLSRTTPVHFASFERLLEIISTDETDATCGRERFRQYRQRGYPLAHFVAK
ncbi:MAG: DNA polymerase III subunit chi [Glaciimonas sp.]|nr:DNA polymerase III subunit chi [Glaciimonas sp.]